MACVVVRRQLLRGPSAEDGRLPPVFIGQEGISITTTPVSMCLHSGSRSHTQTGETRGTTNTAIRRSRSISLCLSLSLSLSLSLCLSVVAGHKVGGTDKGRSTALVIIHQVGDQMVVTGCHRSAECFIRCWDLISSA